ncbi:MAG TPA: hypothetical protein VF131_20265 [Blastocatellia bacterium]|nr:hypothetical protein [Blastocatellia bacterium]
MNRESRSSEGRAVRTTGKGAPKQTVAEIPGFPFDTFEELQTAVSKKSFSLGVDSLAAAEWLDKSALRFKKVVVVALSLLLFVAAIAAAVAAFWIGDYWLLAAVPIQALSFYLSQPSSPIRKWITVAGAASIIVFANLLFNRSTTAATLVAYAGLTFAAVRAAGYIADSAFRKALLSDEHLFLLAYDRRACTLRNNRTKEVYQSPRVVA